MSLPLPPMPGMGMDPMMDPSMMGMANIPPPMPPPMDPNMQQLFDQSMSPFMQQEELSPPPEEQKEPKRQKPSAEEALNRITAIKEEWLLRDERMDEDKDYYDLNIGDTTAAGNLVVRNIFPAMVEKVARMIGSHEPVYSVIPPKNVLKEEAQEMEDFIRHSWRLWNRNWYLSGHSSIYHDMAHFLALRGWLAARIRYNPDAHVQEHPVKMRLIDPRQVYPMFSEEDGAILYLAHVYSLTVAQVKDMYPDATGEWTGREDEELVSCKAYYDDWWYGFYIDDEEVIPIQEHGYGFVPWIVTIASGTPIRSTEADTTDWVRDVGPSIFEHVKEPVLAVMRIMSQLADEVERQSNPPLLYFVDAQNISQPKVINFDPGAQNYLLFDRERVEPLSLGVRANEAQPLLNMLMEDIEKGGLPSSLWGGEGESGFAAALSTGASRDALFPIVRCMEYSQEEIMRKTLTIIRDFHDDDIGFFTMDENGERVSGATINFELIDQIGVENNVKYKDVSPQDKIAKANIAMALVNSKLISLETARSDYLELDNPQRENERVITDLVYMDEEFVKGPLTQDVLMRNDPWLYSLWAQYQQSQQMQPPMGGPPGAPPGPGGAPGPVPGGMEGNLPPQQVPGLGPGLPSDTLPPVMQGTDPLLQALGGSAAGLGLQAPPGIPGAGALPLRMPLG